MFKKVLITGASRGLGRSLAHHCGIFLPSVEELTLIARNQSELEQTQKSLTSPPAPFGSGDYKAPQASFVKAMDLTSDSHVEALASTIKDYDLVIYSAGGGPYGPFSQKEFKDHEWAFKLNFLTPAKLCHQWLKDRSPQTPGRFVIVGSRIAESAPDSGASSYAAAKHAIKGLVSSLQEELIENKNQVGLFSPGYMDTAMLPSGAHVRHDGTKLFAPETAAQVLLRWVVKEGPWHRVL